VRIDAFHRKVEVIMGAYVNYFPLVEPVENDDGEPDWYEDDDDEDERVGEQPENTTLAMPSTFGAQQCQDRGLENLMHQEMEL
jgi:hypothetical protein